MLEESYGIRIKYFYKKIIAIFLMSVVFAFFYSNQNNMYEVIKELFNNLSDVYSILIGFNISSVIFIVSFLLKENNFLDKYTNKKELNNYYQQIVNSFMLSTLINLAIIVLGIAHLTLIDIFKIKTIYFNFKNSFLIYVLNSIYVSLWFFLIFCSIIVFFRCVITLTRLLRISKL